MSLNAYEKFRYYKKANIGYRVAIIYINSIWYLVAIIYNKNAACHILNVCSYSVVCYFFKPVSKVVMAIQYLM